MSLTKDWQARELQAFGGARLLSDPSMVNTLGAILAHNVEYSAGMVGTRHGFKSVGALGVAGGPNTTATDMYSWLGPFGLTATGKGYSGQNLVWFSPTLNGGSPAYAIVNVGAAFDIGGAPLGILGGSPGGVNATFVGVGERLYIAVYDANQRGVCGGSNTTLHVDSGTGNLTPTSSANNPLFVGPMAYTPAAPTEPGAGVVTAGVHRFGYILEFDSGFSTRMSPDSGALTPPSITSFQPISFTAAGAKNLSFVLNPASWQNGTVAVSMAMTTTDDLNQYYIVPGSRTTIANVADHPKTIIVNISDADLSSQGIDATQYLYWLTNQPDTGGAPQFFPSHIALWGDRMAYKAYVLDNKGNKIDALYVSERNGYQSITADQHVIQLPGQRPISTMFHMNGVDYIAGPHEIYSVTDNNDVPVSWASPHLVDGRHGTLAIHGVEVAPSGSYAWIADQGGLFLFTGAPITALPVSYHQTPDWSRINWTAAGTVKVKDDAGTKRVYVMAPLDGATSPTHILTFDYTGGATADAVMYSLDSLAGYSVGAMELVRNDLSGAATGNAGKIELWLGPSASAPIMRKTSDADTTPWRDGSSAINSPYRTCPFPGRDQGQAIIQSHHGFVARLKGAGIISPTLYDIDAVRSFACRALTLSATPDQDELFLAEIRNELGFIEFATNTLDAHWTLMYLKYYWSPWLMQR